MLERALRQFRYTLDNPSGQAANPLEDFLERTQAGHCEYFASAMALMLRARGVPARVVNGFRLGPWIPEGGYFRVSQDQAHSWVEYWDQGRWHVADPTPAGAGQGPRGRPLGLGILTRWLDTLRYHWDRHVVRFSDQDQVAGLSWLQARIQGWEWRWKAPPAGLSWGLAAAGRGLDRLAHPRALAARPARAREHPCPAPPPGPDPAGGGPAGGRDGPGLAAAAGPRRGRRRRAPCCGSPMPWRPKPMAAGTAQPPPWRRLRPRSGGAGSPLLLRELLEGLHELHGQREDDGAVLLHGDLREGLQVAHLDGRGVLADLVGGLQQLLAGHAARPRRR